MQFGEENSSTCNYAKLCKAKQLFADMNKLLSTNVSRNSPSAAIYTSNQTENRPRKKPRRSDDNFKVSYHKIYLQALVARWNEGVDKLSAKECCAILFVSHDIFHKDTKISRVDVKEQLMVPISSKSRSGEASVAASTATTTTTGSAMSST